MLAVTSVVIPQRMTAKGHGFVTVGVSEGQMGGRLSLAWEAEGSHGEPRLTSGQLHTSTPDSCASRTRCLAHGLSLR